MNLFQTILAYTATIAVVIVFFIIACVDKKTKINTMTIALGAIFLAMSFGLSYFRLIKNPQGGSLTLASMLPMIIAAYIFGTRKGMLFALAYATLQIIQDFYFLMLPQFLLDYFIAFGVIGLSGLFNRIKPIRFKFLNIELGLLIAVVCVYTLRYIAHVLSGVVFFAEFAGDMNPWIYSMVYNSVVMMEMCISIGLCILLCANKNVINMIRNFETEFIQTVGSKMKNKKNKEEFKNSNTTVAKSHGKDIIEIEKDKDVKNNID